MNWRRGGGSCRGALGREMSFSQANCWSLYGIAGNVPIMGCGSCALSSFRREKLALFKQELAVCSLTKPSKMRSHPRD